MQPTDVRANLSHQLGPRAVTDKLWDYLVKDGDVAQVVNGKLPLHKFTDKVIDLLEATGRTSLIDETAKAPTMLERTARGRDRALLLSRLMADAAAAEPGVIAFRQEALGGRLLAPDEIEAWITKTSAAEGAPTNWLALPLPEGHSVTVDASGQVRIEPPVRVTAGRFGLETKFLDYAVPESRWTRCAPVTRGGALDGLRELSASLSQKYDWDPAAAAIFVLAGMIPLAGQLKVTVTANSSTFKRRTVTLEIDPALPPREVARRYSEIRRRIISGRRPRDLSEKHLSLAEFLTSEPQEPWATRMQRWNRAHPKWKYNQESNFRRDCLKARERMLAPVCSPAQVFGAIAEPAASQTTASRKKG